MIQHYRERFESGKITLPHLFVLQEIYKSWLDNEAPFIVEDRVRDLKEWMVEEDELPEDDCAPVFEYIDNIIENRFHVINPDQMYEDLVERMKELYEPEDEILFWACEAVYLAQMIRDLGAKIRRRKKNHRDLSKLISEITEV